MTRERIRQSAMMQLALYDIPSKLPGKSWSPNIAKPRCERPPPAVLGPLSERPRLVLGYKNLPFQTIWVELPDIAPKLKEIGASPTKSLNGNKRYTLPILSDLNAGALISDSWNIAEYLDKTYPEKPIFPKDSNGLITAFESAVIKLLGYPQKLAYLRTQQILNECSLECFTTAREAAFGEKVDEWSPEGTKREAHWRAIEKGYFGTAKMWYDRVEGRWSLGDTFSYADVAFAARLFWFQRIFRDDEWKRIASLHDGKWERLLMDVVEECNLALPPD